MTDKKYHCDHSPGSGKKELDLICRTCLRAWIARHNKMLEFIEQLADESVYERYENLNEMNWAAFDLLKEIGEIE